MGASRKRSRYRSTRLLDAAYKNGMFTRGLPTIQADELHSYEEGINCLAQNLILDYGSPRQIERAMETARGSRPSPASTARATATSARPTTAPPRWPRKIRGAGRSPTPISCCRSRSCSSTTTAIPRQKISPRTRRWPPRSPQGRRERPRLAPAIDSFHRRRRKRGHRGSFPGTSSGGAYKWTGDRRYLDPIFDGGNASVMAVNANVLDLLDLRKDLGRARSLAAAPTPAGGRSARRCAAAAISAAHSAEHFAWQVSGDKSPSRAALRRRRSRYARRCAYINTEGSLWIDRVTVPYRNCSARVSAASRSCAIRSSPATS